MVFFAKTEGVIGHFDFEEIELPNWGCTHFRNWKAAAVTLTGNLFGIAAEQDNVTAILDAFDKGHHARLIGNRPDDLRVYLHQLCMARVLFGHQVKRHLLIIKRVKAVGAPHIDTAASTQC